MSEPLTSKTADQLRTELVNLFAEFEPHLRGYHAYAEKSHALSIEFHRERLKEVFPKAEFIEAPVLGTFSAVQTPKSLDVKLSQLTEAPVGRIIFDPITSTYYLLT